MAYLDGELPVGRASEVAAHLDQCRDCRALAADLRSLDQQMAAWQVEPSPASLAERVQAAMEARPAEAPSGRSPLFAALGRRALVRPWVWAVAGVTAVFLLVGVSFNFIERRRSQHLMESVSLQSQDAVGVVGGAPGGAPAGSAGGVIGGPRGAANLNGAPSAPQPLEGHKSLPVNERSFQRLLGGLRERGTPAGGGVAGKLEGDAGMQEQALPDGPLIVRTASLTLVTKEFDKARAAVEEIVRQHHGYAAQLTVNAPGGAGRTLTATLRVPADQLDAALGELKKLGRVEQESQGGEEVTQQYVDLNARLKNARETEERLIDVLRDRTGKVKDILAVEQEIARVRGEIEQMEAESKNLEHQVRYAALQLNVNEEYKAALEVAPPSTGTLLRNSLVEGYRGVVDSFVGILIFLASNGPVLIFWLLLLFWPARFAWRRLRALASTRMAPAVDATLKSSDSAAR